VSRQGKRNRTSKAYANPSKFDRQNIVSDYVKNLYTKLQTSSGPNVAPVRVLKPSDWHPQYDANEGGGTVPAWYNGTRVSLDPTDRRFQSNNGLPNQRETMGVLSHELGHQRASYQLGGDKTLAYLDMYNQQHPAAPGAFEEVRRKVALAKQNNQSMFNGGLPVYSDWNPALTEHDQPSEIWASQYADALTQGKVNQLPSKWGNRSTFTPDMGPTAATYLQGKGALPQGTVDPIVASGVASRDMLFGADYSKEKRRVARKLNDANYPHTALARTVPVDSTTTTTTKPPPKPKPTTTKHKDKMNRLDKTRNQRRKEGSTTTSFSNGA